MHDNKPDQFVDELLEAALKRYGGEEPRAGLEMRVLAGIRSRQGTARRRRLVWAVAVCAGALTAVVLLLHSAHGPKAHRVTTASVPHPAAALPATPGSADSRLWSPRLVQGPKQKPRTPKAGVRASKPSRPEQFPTPLPLTEQEKLLIAYVKKATRPDLGAEADKTNEPQLTDLKIPLIEIEPLEIEPLDDTQSRQEK